MNPFDLRGPEFLSLYVVLFGVGLAVAFALRSWALATSGRLSATTRPDLAPYEVAYLASGPTGAVNAALSCLAQIEAVRVSVNGGTLTPLLHNHCPADPLEAAVFQEIRHRPGASVAALHRAELPPLQEIRKRLRSQGLLLNAEQARQARALPPLPLWLLLAFGVVKIGVGLSRDRPVGFLVVLCLVTAVVALCFMASPVFRTRTGEDLLTWLQVRHAALHYSHARREQYLAGDDLVLAVGLYGSGVLSASGLPELGAVLTPASSGGSSCGDGGGGGGCGGGGGGGCGGCGGG